MRHRSAQVAVARGAALTLALLLAAACGQKAGVGDDAAAPSAGIPSRTGPSRETWCSPTEGESPRPGCSMSPI